jgi:hypothetical protein
MRGSLKTALLVLLFITGIICQESDPNSEFPQITSNQPDEVVDGAAPKPHIQPGAPEIVIEPGPQKVETPIERLEKSSESQGDEVTLKTHSPTEETFPPEVTEQDPFATTAAPGLTTVIVENAAVKEIQPEAAAPVPLETKPEENQAVEENNGASPQQELSQPSPESPPVSPVVIEEASAAPETESPIDGSVPDITATENTGTETSAPITQDPTAVAQSDDDVFAGDKALFQQEGTKKMLLTEELATTPVEVSTKVAVTIEPVFPRIELPAETGEDKEEEPEAIKITQQPLENQSETQVPVENEKETEGECKFTF